MSPRPFYEVKPSHYLFNKQETPEEKVRQWILFELLSTYAVPIGNIDVEKPVRVGTRTHRADIVIYQDFIPYIVIECKNQEDKSPDQGLDQAISYASCLGAKFAVYTNGWDWLEYRHYIYTMLQEFFMDCSWYCNSEKEVVLHSNANEL
ncbi:MULTISPECIES: type I restriction enzyme HsdR N-terminal domain-containing protein [Cyanophyceae]|uniref:type I restriction enzyme HsdR N-terminal domain-containing protein n=1 Tax=Cyanophyceae TaxID=3028117 RepID=UPI001688BF63|nr:type I restriction enzyme HsdR N-terminal domain-containing protein [Trichocoleus sp. FACHB-69]MBD1933689.1 type I restriction enzyme HsdR N-terminal domain-containing protein [Trichocoleus sp. FACHB-69]